MPESNLTKKEALELITPVVDDEVEEGIRIAFFKYIEKDSDVRDKYESVKRLKELVATRCPCVKAPHHLKEKIRHILSGVPPAGVPHRDTAEFIYDRPSSLSDTSKNPFPASFNVSLWKYLVAACLAVVAVFSGLFLYSSDSTAAYNLEEYAYTHFIKHSGQMVEPTIATASMADAETELSRAFGMAVTIPPVTNAEFKGVVYSEFVPDFKSPMLEYYLPSDDQYIYIFAFNINHLNQFKELIRNEEAVKTCIQSRDFHISNINGKHVVSWKWDNTWYTAISNHNGKILASMVEGLKELKD